MINDNKAAIVIAHYDEDLNWTNTINLDLFNIVIYSKTLQTEEIILQEKNLGNEASSYLQYIVDNYDNLPEHNFFVHAHNTSYHQTLTHEDFFSRVKLPPPTGYYNFNRRDWYCDGLKDEPHTTWNTLLEYWPVSSTQTTLAVPENLRFYTRAQFYVTRDLILRHSKEAYSNLLEFIYTDKVPPYWCGRIFEYMWHYIFTGLQDEPKISYEEILN